MSESNNSEGYANAPGRNDTDVVGARIGAQVIDTIAIVAVFFVPILVFGGLGGGGESTGGFALIGLLVGGVGAFFYQFLLEGYWNGQTLGKRLFGIKVVEENGSPCGYGSAFVRNLLEILDGLFYYLVGFIVMAITDKRQRIGDRLAGTIVVREE